MSEPSTETPARPRPRGHLQLNGGDPLSALRDGMRLCSLDVSGRADLTRLPAGLEVGHLILSGCTGLEELPPGLRCDELDLSGSGIRELPTLLEVRHVLRLDNCKNLTTIPAGLRAGTVSLRGCTGLTQLPAAMAADLLDVSGCTRLAGWRGPGNMKVFRLISAGCTALTALPGGLGPLAELNVSGCVNLRELPEGPEVVKRLSAGGCPRLSRLPSSLRAVEQLDVGGCAGLRELPEGLRVTGWVEVAGSGLTGPLAKLPKGGLRWRGVSMDARSVFRPETITALRVLREENAERRRVLLERMGYERFFTAAKATVLDSDRDAGGERRLLRVALPRDEDLVCVAVTCPSTGQHYLLRVPPSMTTCRQAVAWVAGFDDPDEYNPQVET